ncbi:MAG: hypothetical protein NTV23_05105 [Propionibacteriales bacterium]|nr:hypothetical protein [Propionibacteriales bacterium]
MRPRGSLPPRWRSTLLAGAGFFVLQLGWILCIAPHFGIDEFDHAYRASSVAAGNWEPGDQTIPTELGRGDLIPVRADVAEAARAACTARPYTGVYNCRPMTELPGGEILIASAASRYNPTFYAAVGIPARPFSGTANLYAMRVAAALIGCLLFAMAVRLTIAGARTVWPLVALLVAALPTTVYSSAIASPNGVEMLAGLGTWVALGAVVQPRGDQRRRTAYWMLATFAAVLVSTHTLGLLWLGLILGATAVLHGPVRTVRALLPTTRLEAACTGLVTAASAFEIAWVLLSGVNNPTLDRSNFSGNPWEYVAQGAFLWPLQAIGAFPMRNEAAPPAAYALVVVVLVALVVTAVRRCGLRSRPALGLGVIALVSFAVPTYLTVHTFHQLGSAWQGRYGMPFTVGLIVVAGALLDASGTRSHRSRALGVGAVVAVVLAQLISQWSVMTKQRSNFQLVTDTHWVPPSAALIITLGGLAATFWVRAVLEHERTPRIGAPVPIASATEGAAR